jgi:hypothetical protein
MACYTSDQESHGRREESGFAEDRSCPVIDRPVDRSQERGRTKASKNYKVVGTACLECFGPMVEGCGVLGIHGDE